jgi:hypothetical protein
MKQACPLPSGGGTHVCRPLVRVPLPCAALGKAQGERLAWFLEAACCACKARRACASVNDGMRGVRMPELTNDSYQEIDL